MDKINGDDLTPAEECQLAAVCRKYECSSLDLTRHVLQEFLRIHRDEIAA